MPMLRFTQALALILATTIAAPAAAQEIGKVASITPNLTGTPPGGSTRALNQGAGVQVNEVVEASGAGRGQLLFRDETTLTIAPNSRIKLDDFVYVPGGGDARFAITLSRGALRMIGGQTTQGRDGLIVTTTATVGIRGSSAIVLVDDRRTTGIFLMGDRMCVGGVCTSRRGGVVTSDGGYLGRVSGRALGQITARLDGAPPSSLRRGSPSDSVTGVVGPWTDPRSTTGRRLPAVSPDLIVETWLDQSIIRDPEIDEGGCDYGNYDECF
ncbi:MAG: FecR domain-containing protein [Pseudomonadota bacterium]